MTIFPVLVKGQRQDFVLFSLWDAQYEDGRKELLAASHRLVTALRKSDIGPLNSPSGSDEGETSADVTMPEKVVSSAEPLEVAAPEKPVVTPVAPQPKRTAKSGAVPKPIAPADKGNRSKVWLILLLAASVMALIFWWANNQSKQPASGTANHPTEQSAQVDNTLAPSAVSAGTPTPQAGTVRDIGGVPFVYVPAGEFEMGSDSEDAYTNEQPVHTVYLDDYWIMQTEVTNAQYAKCVDADACREPDNDHWNDGNYGEHPVTHVSWDDAVTYAEWLSGVNGQAMRLPTEAEWEKAARGVDGRIYPWGDDWDSSLVNYCDRNCEYDWKDESGDDGFARTAPVGSYPDGASPYGALDMAGNVWEWTADWYAYYASSPAHNPQGPEPGDRRVLRGGAFYGSRQGVRSAYRYDDDPNYRYGRVGFRVLSPGLLGSGRLWTLDRCAAPLRPSGLSGVGGVGGAQRPPPTWPSGQRGRQKINN